MRRAFFIFLAMMVYAVWAAAQSSPVPWWNKFGSVPTGVVLATQTPVTYTPTPTYTLTSSPTPSPIPTNGATPK